MTKNLKVKLYLECRLRVQIQTQRAIGTPLGTKDSCPVRVNSRGIYESICDSKYN